MPKEITTKQLYSKILNLEKEIKKVKLVLLKKEDHVIASIAPISLKGAWKGARIAEKNIKAAKQSLFPKHKNQRLLDSRFRGNDDLTNL